MRQTVTASTSQLLHKYLKSTVDDGLAKKAGVTGYSIGGKTGTAEKVPRGSGNYVVSFIGFAPVDDPQVVVYVVVDEPHVADQSHCSQSSYIAKNIFSQILPYMNIERMDSVAAE